MTIVTAHVARTSSASTGRRMSSCDAANTRPPYSSLLCYRTATSRPACTQFSSSPGMTSSTTTGPSVICASGSTTGTVSTVVQSTCTGTLTSSRNPPRNLRPPKSWPTKNIPSQSVSSQSTIRVGCH